MKKTIIVLFMAVLCVTTAFATVRVGVSVMTNTPLDAMLLSLKEEDYEALKENLLKDSEITANASFSLLNLEVGLNTGVRLQEEIVVPLVKVYGGVKVPVLKVLSLGGGVGYHLEFSENEPVKELYWRFSCGLELGLIWLDAIATLPIVEDEGITNAFNFGEKANSAHLGVGLGIKF